MVCNDLDPRSFVQFQDHCRKFLLGPYLIIVENDQKQNSFDLKICLDLELWLIVQVQGHRKKSGTPIFLK